MEEETTPSARHTIIVGGRAVKSAVGVNVDVVDNLTANNNQDDIDTLPPLTLPKKRLFDSHKQPPGRL